MPTPRGYTPPLAPPNPFTAPRGQNQLAHWEVDIRRSEDRDYVRAMTGGIAGASSAMSWLNYRRIGEVRYAIARSARIAGYATLYAQKINPSGDAVEKRDQGVVAEIVQDITSRFAGTRGLIERFYVLRKVPGEMWLAGIRDTPQSLRDGYWFMSPSEVKMESGELNRSSEGIVWTQARVGSVSGQKEVFTRTIAPDDFYGRIWAPDHEYIQNVDTPMIALNDLCEMLDDLTKSIKGRLRQRFIANGILLVPSEINDAAISGDLPGQIDYGTNDKVLRYLIHIMSRNKLDFERAVGQLPIVMKGPGEVLDKVRHVISEARVEETDLSLRRELIDRILDGLDQQKGQVSDEGGSNRFQAWSRSDEERRITVQPDLEAMCHALTRMVLWRELRARGWNDARIRPWRVWYDISAAAVKANIVDEARQAYDRGIVNAAFLRTASGASEIDKMDSAEFVRWVGTKVQNPLLMTYGIDGINVDWDKAAAWGKVSGPNPESGGDTPDENPGVGEPGAPGDRVDDGTPDENPDAN